MIQLFGPRAAIKVRKPIPLQSTDLGGRMNAAAEAGGGIQAGAHPEYEAIKPGLKNPLDMIRGLLGNKKKKPIAKPL